MSNPLTTPTRRAKLAQQAEPHWHELERGLHLGYRNGTRGGVWYARQYDSDAGRYIKRRIGNADDRNRADGVRVLSYAQAAQRVRRVEPELEATRTPTAAQQLKGFTVSDAVDRYLQDYEASGKRGLEATRLVTDRHIVPTLGAMRVSDLSVQQVRRWHRTLAESPRTGRGGEPVGPYVREIETGRLNRVGNPIVKRVPVPPEEWTEDMKRQRRSTANRCLTVLKAVLNHAYTETEEVDDPSAWRKVKPYRAVDAPKVMHLTRDEAARLIRACDDEFRPMVRAALLTGCRWGELCAFVVDDFDPDKGTIRVGDSKSYKPRVIPLSPEGAALFADHCRNKRRHELVFTRTDGTPWKRSHQTRPMAEAVKRAGIRRISFHGLRHTYAVLLLRPADGQAGMSLRYVAELLGNSTAICEKHYGHVLDHDLGDEVRRALPNFGAAS